MNTLQLKNLIRTYSMLLFMLLLFSCNAQKEEPRIVEISSGVLVSGENYMYDNNSLFYLGGNKYSLRHKALYDINGALIKLLLYKSEGEIEYNRKEILEDEKLIEYTGFPLKQNWVYKKNKLVDENGKIKIDKEIDNFLIVDKDRITTFYKVSN
ncbi:hypothetical protein [Mesonia aestuariivivens]|uniref:LPS export ABC transporter periplasmic protein LptC n=1 Tax=Mesonia aestuariivivens TaxID=2796128 RepID=A0ABS6W5H9_9FLAO|nr:hypothetical protein [Mesonia aestuariivivens]MBW2963120.1 hypothetical protein [Mesonia aestuariivivens]